MRGAGPHRHRRHGQERAGLQGGNRHTWRFPGGVAYVRASEFGFRLDAALIDLARSLGLEATDNTTRKLLDYVNTTPCLLVLDNLERAGSELPRLAEVINALNFDAGSKVLLTLRPPLSDRFQHLREINLHAGLDAANALAYVRFIAANEGAPAQWQNPVEAGALADRVKGHPELMRLTVFRSKQTPWPRVKQELANLSGRLDVALQELIGKQVEQAGDLGKIALTRLALFPQPRVLCEAALAACGDAVNGLDNLKFSNGWATQRARPPRCTRWRASPSRAATWTARSTCTARFLKSMNGWATPRARPPR